MEPRKHSLSELFDGKLVYVVPNYQRLYVWSQEDQWDPLWSDVRDIADGLIASAPGTALSGDRSDEADVHFLGAVVFKISGSTPDLARQYRVIDGQQRLTTLQILLAAASSALDAVVRTDTANNLRQLTENLSKADPLKIKHQRHSRGHDYEHFADVMRAANSGASDPVINGPMVDCYRFFRQTIQQWLSDYGDQLDDASSALATALALKLHVVAIYLDPHEKEHAIFESLNARGEPLTEWDKIKNYLIYKAEQDVDLEQGEFFECYLDTFDDSWWREPVGRGVQRPRADVFVDYWLESKKQTPVAVRRVFREFQDYVDNGGEPLEQVMKQLLEDAEYYRKAEEGEPSDRTREVLFHRRRVAMNTGAVWPLLFRIRALECDQREKERCLALLESYLVHRIIAGYQARSYDQVALDLVGALSIEDNLRSVPSGVIERHLLSYSESGTLWPHDGAIAHGVMNRTLPRYAQKLILSAVETSLITARAGSPDIPAGLHIGHLMPQGWQPDIWPLPEGMDREQAKERRKSAIGTLGNLTLLNGRLNSSISNGSWDVKRAAIAKSDNLFVNRRLLKGSSHEWTEKDIERRGQWMGNMIMKIWQRREHSAE